MASIRTQREFRRRCQEGVPVLMFHKIGKTRPSASLPQLYVSPGRFQELAASFERKTLQSVPMSEAITAKTADSRRFVITFDDGYEGALLYATKTMKAHGFSAIQFLVADMLGRRNEWDAGLDATMERLMDRDQVREWLSLGFDIGAHTRTHPHLTKISMSEAKSEIVGSKGRLEDLFGLEVKHFAYPYGEYNDAIVDLVKEAGFETACTCDPTVVRPGVDSFRLGRFFMHERSIRSFSNYKVAYLKDDLRSLAQRYQRAG